VTNVFFGQGLDIVKALRLVSPIRGIPNLRLTSCVKTHMACHRRTPAQVAGGLVGPCVWLCLSAFDVSLITFCRVEFQEIHFRSHLERFGHNLGSIREPFGRHLGIIWEHFEKWRTMLGATCILIQIGIVSRFIWAFLLEMILHIGGHLWWLGGSEWHRFYSDAFIWRRGRAVGKQMCFPYSQYCARIRFRMLRYLIRTTLYDFCLVWEHFGGGFYTLLQYFEHDYCAICRSGEE